MPVIDHEKHGQPCVIAQAASPCSEEECVDDPHVTLPPALLEIQLTKAAAQQMRQLLDDPNHPSYAGSEMPAADASILHRKVT